jgi:excinuclease ABC subunit A
MDAGFLHVVGARQHNLKNVELRIPRGAVTVITGVSGSGKSSLAFDTIHAEGRRRYVESLSLSARQFLAPMQRPDVDRIEGLSPTLALEQRSAGAGPRSTVATATDIHDFLRVLFARVGRPICWKCGRTIHLRTTAQIVDAVLAAPAGRRILVLAPLVQDQRGAHDDVFDRMRREGFVRARVDGQVVSLDALLPLAARQKHTIETVIDRLTVKPEAAARLADSLEIASRLGDGRILIASEIEPGRWLDEPFSARLACPVHPEVHVGELSAALFSFQSPQGACTECHGLGIRMEFDPDLVVPDRGRPLAEGAIAPWRRAGRRGHAEYESSLKSFCEGYGVCAQAAFRDLTPDAARVLLFGSTDDGREKGGMSFEGVIPGLQRRWRGSETESARRRLYEFLAESPCESCSGTRLRPEALCVRIDGRSIADLTALTVAQAARFFAEWRVPPESEAVAVPLVAAINQRLRFLMEVGVEYPALNRPCATLSNGEWQRIRLATQIGGGLSGVCYVLDEPTVGLHPRDSRRLAENLRKLAEMGNTVLVVEHDEEVIRAADFFFEMGPGAGAQGGHVVAAGPLPHVLESQPSATAGYLSGSAGTPIPGERRSPNWTRCLDLRGATAHNLKDVDLRIPLGCFVCVTGVSGSGKSTLVWDVLLRALRRALEGGGPRPGAHRELLGASWVDRLVEVDASPIGRTPRGNPATYVGALAPIRELFAQTREARVRGYGPARFSFNVRGGRCDACEGQGVRRIAMHFLPDVYVPCPLCAGKRYNRETLEIRYRGKSVADVLDFSVEEATAFFENFPRIHARLKVLGEVGLGYLRLGQASNTLSGGEAQRIKLADELHRGGEGHTLYVLDEPTTGLHFEDVRRLLGVLTRLVERGHTLIVIEHQLDVMLNADWIIDLGPEGGEAGGRVVAEGTPEQVARCADGHTGRFLAERLAKNTKRSG